MKKVVSYAFAGLLGLATVATGMPASAGPIAPANVAKSVDANMLLNIQDRRTLTGQRKIWRKGWNGNRNWNNGRWDNGRRWNRNRNWRGNYYRPRYRNNSGVYLGLGLGLGAAPFLYNDYYAPRRIYRGSSAHVRWCSARYKTYRAWDNTYVPRRGVRAQCHSPYA